jgi:hypothetical protein
VHTWNVREPVTGGRWNTWRGIWFRKSKTSDNIVGDFLKAAADLYKTEARNKVGLGSVIY